MVHEFSTKIINASLGGGFKHFIFSPLPGEMIQFDEHIFQMGRFNHQLVINAYSFIFSFCTFRP